jgi:spore maturation protein CgeB
MRFAFFVHSAVSDWNHGNAHFLRGLMSALARRGHAVSSHEPRGGWSAANLVRDHGLEPVVAFARAFPELEVRDYDPLASDLPERIAAAVEGADVVVVHEWNDPAIVSRIAAAARAAGAATLFHDTHHRPWSDPGAIARFDLRAFDGVVAFGEVLRRIYRERFGVRRSWTMHEAADVVRFRPLRRPRTQDVVWIGNWGDGERTGELRDFWLGAAARHRGLRFVAHGVRYPARALRELAGAGVEYRGWAASLDVPEIYAASGVTLHVPRRAYVRALAGIPTIRVFEALACGIPLVCAPWSDDEGLFRDGDYVAAASPAEMAAALHRLAVDEEARARQAERGVEIVLGRHTCDHRAEELLEIVRQLGAAGGADAAAPGAAREAACA